MNPEVALMETLDATAGPVAMVTGMKQQLIDQGWSDEGAERLVIHWITSANG